MVIPADVLGFVKAHEFDRVLSLYVRRGRNRTESARRGTEAATEPAPDVSSAPRAVHDGDAECLAHANALVAALPQTREMAGAMCLYAADGDHVESLLPVAPTPMERWSVGPIIFPFLASNYSDGFVIVHVTDYDITVSRLQRGAIHLLDECAITSDDDRCLVGVAKKLGIIAGSDGYVVLGGALGVAERLRALLPTELAQRCVLAPAMTRQTPVAELADCAFPAMQDLLTVRQSETLRKMKTKAHLTRRASFGLNDVAAAAKEGAVDSLLISDSLWRRNPRDVEVLAQQALRSGANVDVVTPACAERLDSEAGGIAAGLRRAVTGAIQSRR